MDPLTRAVLAIALTALLGWGLVMYGKSIVKKEWDIETAKREETARIADETNKGAIEREKLERAKILAAAKSQAGRDAVAAYLRTHGVLPSGTPLQPTQPSAANQSSSGLDAAPTECRTGGDTASIEAFAMSCALDAAHVIRCQQFIRDNPQAFEILE